MDILQIALVFLIIILSIFMSVLGFQVFLILKDLRRDLNKLDRLVRSEIQAHDMEPEVLEGEMMVRSQNKAAQRTPASSKPRFYKKILR